MGKKQKAKKTADSKVAASDNVASPTKIAAIADMPPPTGVAAAAAPEAATVDTYKQAYDVDPMSKKRLLFERYENLKSLTEKLQSVSFGSKSSTVVHSESDSDDETSTEQKRLAALRSMEIPSSNPKFLDTKHSRGEKKARRLLMKHDLKRMPNVTRVTMRKDKNVLLYIDHPDVYQFPNSLTYIFFGEVHVDNTANAAATQAAERYINDGRPSQQSPNATTVNNNENIDNNAGACVDNGDEGIEDDGLGSELDEKDIELVVMQAVCSRQAAIKALLKHNSDIVNAIMELTVGAGV